MYIFVTYLHYIWLVKRKSLSCFLKQLYGNNFISLGIASIIFDDSKLLRVSLSAAELPEHKVGRCSNSSVNTNLIL